MSGERVQKIAPFQSSLKYGRYDPFPFADHLEGLAVFELNLILSV